MKKALIFSLAYYPHVGGAEVAVKEITDRTPDLEFHMVTQRFTAADAAQEQVGNVLVHRIGPAGKSIFHKFVFQILAARAALKLDKAHHYAAVWALMAHSAGVPAVLFKMRKPEVLYVLNLQEGDPPEKIERTMLPLWPLFSRAFTMADIVQPLSNFLAAWARKRGFKGPIEIIPNGADVGHFKGEKIAHEGTVLITTSRLVHKNAVDDVIRALPQLPGVRFQVLGIGPEEKMLRELAAKEGVAQRVEFLGHVDHKEMPAYLHRADIFIRPSRSEGQGASFIEAMAAGLPVIATQEGGIADFLFDATRNPDKIPTGWAVDRDSPPQIVDAVRDILSNPEVTKRVVENAKTLALQKYDWDLIARKMREKVFGNIL